jgi:hypothetical protein
MNRFAFPSEWMARNWPQKTVSERAASSAAGFVPIVEIRLMGAVIQVAAGQVLQGRQPAEAEQAGARATIHGPFKTGRPLGLGVPARR